jgi:DNA-binding helix-hairpin-helix protein with protein kinase domain
MTTRPSSSHPGSPPKAESLIAMADASGQTVLLEQMIGKGGEGSVFAVHGEPALAAKVYHQTPIPERDFRKLEAMIALRTPDLDKIAAWPQAILYNPHRKEPSGILLPKVVGAHHLHELYGTANRRRYFPEAKWHHLVLAARNVAAAFDSMHEQGIVIGDVNQGNLLVDSQMCVRFIDCDSFQLTCGDEQFLCPVGTPHFTPPEMQGKKLREVPRDANHDRFGLAVLMFHLLFVGRHPFAGRFFGPGEMTIERAIAEGRFAFSRARSATLMEPPPASLHLDDLPKPLAELFERAFRNDAAAAPRPTAQEWAVELEDLIRRRTVCSFDQAHVYFNNLPHCPWCRIEDEGGPAFFLADAGASIVSPDRLKHLEDKIRRLTIPAFPEVPLDKLKIPQPLRAKAVNKFGTMKAPDYGALLLAAGALACVTSIFSGWLLAAGTAACAAGGGLMMFSREGKLRRQNVDDLLRKLGELQQTLIKRAHGLTTAHRKRQSDFETAVEELRTEVKLFADADKQLKDVLSIYRVQQKNRYLAQHMLQEHYRRIRGLNPTMVSVLQSYGIESAQDLESMRLLGVPMLSSELTLELLSWRRQIEQGFIYKSEHGVELDPKEGGGKLAVARFKTAQARRILIATKQLESLAQAGRDELARDLRAFESPASRAHEIVKELKTLQTSRRRWEREINKSPAVIAGAAAAPPLIGLILRWLFA